MERKVEEFISDKLNQYQTRVVKVIFLLVIFGLTVAVATLNIYKAVTVINPKLTEG
jgi:hypothetical protein